MSSTVKEAIIWLAGRKAKRSKEEVLAYLEKRKSRTFDPDILECLSELIKKYRN